MVGITRIATYFPRRRLERALIAKAWGTRVPAGTRTVAGLDEDALTMATDAVLARVADADPAAFDALYFAGPGSPYLEKQVASVIATAADLRRDVVVADFAGSVRAGVAALRAALDGVRAGSLRTALVAAADARLAEPESELEPLLGDGAAAVAVGSEGVVAELVSAASVAEEFTYVWRTDEQRTLRVSETRFGTTYGYVRDMAEVSGAPPSEPMGEPVTAMIEWKELKQDMRLYGSRCEACGLVQYPQARVCIGCQARDRMQDHKLGKRGSVFTFTIDNLAPVPEHPMPMAVIDLDGGGRVYLQVTDAAEGEVKVGAPGELTFRRLHEAAGAHDVVLVLGAEKLKDRGGRGIPRLGHPLLARGNTAPGLFALAANRYMHTFGLGRETLAKVAVKNHRNGARNEKAHLRMEVSEEQVLKAPIIAWPFGLLDCCPTTDGAAAAIICRADLAKRFRKPPVLVKGAGLAVATGRPYFDPTFDYLGFRSTQAAARQAYQAAGITAEDIDFAEVHDCFTWTEISNIEDLAFCKKGEGGKLVEEGRTALEGDLPVNPSGGLKSFGHPIGASGVRMIYECVTQLRGEAGSRQVKDPELGLAHNVGGPGAVCCLGRLGRSRRARR